MNFNAIFSFLFRRRCAKQMSESLTARFSHEIRTQLTGIIGYAEFLEEKTNEPMLNFTAKIIRESGLNLSRISSSYFELNNLSKGDIKLSFSGFVFFELVRDVVRRQSEAALNKGVRLSFSCAQEITKDIVSCDVNRLRQVLEALIIGTVELLGKWSILHLILSRDAARGVWFLNMEFSDLASKSSGIHLYESFWNNESYNFKLQEGPGVLLSMVKQTLFMMSCKIRFEFDVKAKGARLVIVWPFS